MMNRAVIALGSNIEPHSNIVAALEILSKTFSIVKESRFVFTEPVGYKNQLDFLNGVVLVDTSLMEADIIAQLKRIEQKLGRRRNVRKDGPRKIDLDLVLFNGQILDDDVHERKFLRQSILELLPDFKFC